VKASVAEIPVLTLLHGRARPFARGQNSAIEKSEIGGPIRIGELGLEGDEQADLRHHGGVEKAVHHYAYDHYAGWKNDLRGCSDELLAAPGAFGENISTLGLTEEDVCVGDIWRVGTVLLQVSQARQPCWKLSQRFGIDDMAERVQTSGRTGWYYRVLESGSTAAGDLMSLVERPHADWPLSRILQTFYVDLLDRRTLEGILGLEELTASWRTLAQRRLESGRIEDWTPRLKGESGP